MWEITCSCIHSYTNVAYMYTCMYMMVIHTCTVCPHICLPEYTCTFWRYNYPGLLLYTSLSSGCFGSSVGRVCLHTCTCIYTNAAGSSPIWGSSFFLELCCVVFYGLGSTLVSILHETTGTIGTCVVVFPLCLAHDVTRMICMSVWIRTCMFSEWADYLLLISLFSYNAWHPTNNKYSTQQTLPRLCVKDKRWVTEAAQLLLGTITCTKHFNLTCR